MPVSILTGSEEPVQRYEVNTWTNPNAVSILTGSEEPVQLADKGFLRERTVVSILTGSEEPVQRALHVLPAMAAASFNPHRLRRAGATFSAGTIRHSVAGFQSSPAPKSRCNRGHQPGGFPGRSFNPHRLRRAGATRVEAVRIGAIYCFNPHRLRRAGATRATLIRQSKLCGFNPHRLRRAGATPLVRESKQSLTFQSSPAPKSRCNRLFHYISPQRKMFQSSPAPKSRCNKDVALSA